MPIIDKRATNRLDIFLMGIMYTVNKCSFIIARVIQKCKQFKLGGQAGNGGPDEFIRGFFEKANSQLHIRLRCCRVCGGEPDPALFT
ncbi:hypothetical protein D3C74_444400 [compost metagenome]